MNETDVSQFITFKDLIIYIMGSSGLLAIIFSIVSKLFDKTTRVMIMNEIKSIDEKYQKRLGLIDSEVTNVKLNYLDRFTEQKELITDNKERAEANHSEIKQILVGIKKDLETLQHQTKQKE
jgi:hypothetical protein